MALCGAMRANALEEQQDTRIRDRVIDVISVTSGRENTAVLQDTELLANQRLPSACGFRNLANRSRDAVVVEIVDDAESQRMRSVAYDRGNTLQRLHIDEVIIGDHLIRFLPNIIT